MSSADVDSWAEIGQAGPLPRNGMSACRDSSQN